MKKKLTLSIRYVLILGSISWLLACASKDDGALKKNNGLISTEYQDSLMNQTPMKYYVFGRFVKLSVYHNEIKPLGNDSIRLFVIDNLSYYLTETDDRKIFTNSNDFVIDSSTYLIFIERNKTRLINEVNKNNVDNIVTLANLEGNKIIYLDVTSNKTVIEKCRVDENNYLYYNYNIEVFYKVCSISVSIEVYDKVTNIDFEKIYLMKNSIKIVSPII